MNEYDAKFAITEGCEVKELCVDDTIPAELLDLMEQHEKTTDSCADASPVRV